MLESEKEKAEEAKREEEERKRKEEKKKCWEQNFDFGPDKMGTECGAGQGGQPKF